MKRWIAAVLVVLSALFTGQPVFAEQAPFPYTVQPGDTVWRIAQRFEVGMDDIIGQNRLKNPDLIYPGQRLLIPRLDPKVKSFEQRVIQLTNQARTAQGLKPLRSNWELSRMARHKSEDMRDRGYFSHQSPTYGSPFDMMRAYGIPYRAAGENIAAGQPTPEEVVKAWLASPGHRRNIMNPAYTEIGCGVAFGGSMRIYWSQEFIMR
ncbi:CAP domain-containing protein [Effusibacillus pohliae]|uniref:CAP domain-containing protein n=1 Tax=Effusibacillus pohliae TaxID=232270 RepID=UPI00036B65A9|nr:CAP domain-containing protein [Effusibacillus pohliae]